MYYDIDDILAESQKLPCQFTTTISNLGYLNNQPINTKIKLNDKLELPLWLSKKLSMIRISNIDNSTFLELNTPEFLTKNFLNFIKSSPTFINLNKFEFFYILIYKWCEIFDDEVLINSVCEMFLQRIQLINDLSFKNNEIFNNNNLNFIQGLDSFEKLLFKQSHDSYKDVKIWFKSK